MVDLFEFLQLFSEQVPPSPGKQHALGLPIKYQPSSYVLELTVYVGDRVLVMGLDDVAVEHDAATLAWNVRAWVEFELANPPPPPPAPEQLGHLRIAGPPRDYPDGVRWARVEIARPVLFGWDAERTIGPGLALVPYDDLQTLGNLIWTPFVNPVLQRAGDLVAGADADTGDAWQRVGHGD